MKLHTLGVASLAAILVAVLPVAAFADVYINGTGDLRPHDLNLCNKYGTMSIRCAVYGPTLISFKDKDTGKVCGWKVENQQVGFGKRRWDIVQMGNVTNRIACRYHWTNGNTVAKFNFGAR